MRLAQLNQPFPAGSGKGDTGRVVKRWDGIKERRMVLCQIFFQRLDHQAVFIHGQADDVQSMVSKDVKGQKIARLFHKNGITGFGEKGADQIESLGGPGCDKEIVGINGFMIVFSQKPGQCESKISVPRFRAVCQKGCVVMAQAMFGGSSHQCQRQQ